MKFNILSLTIILIILSLRANGVEFPSSQRAEKAISQVELKLKEELTKKGLEYGSPIFIRIFKQSATLEVWLATSEGKYAHFKDYSICIFSGELGPKTKQGDLQSPEGFYFVNAARLNPWSRFHLSFNLGYPNQYDRYHGRTGSALMVHGNCVSIGCYAMTDDYINEIYALSVAALKNGQPFFRVHAFPFKLEDKILEHHKENQWYSFWLNLKEGYELFNNTGNPPNVRVEQGRYIFDSVTQRQLVEKVQ
ncbi:MAG: murein L,D-transpeptidase [Kangiellaceae bacterium]|nr:murein L,D-transpeptidase [Kangiellaceae bacterium]